MIITAKYASVCPLCNARIEVGSKVEWSKGEKARHATCGAPVAQVTQSKPGVCSKCGKACKSQYRTCFGCSGRQPSAESVRNTYRRRYGWDGVEGSPSYYTSGLYDEES